MRHILVTRSAYGPGWSLEANRRRLAFSRAVTIRSISGQRGFDWIVLLHREDPLLRERQAAFAGARFLYLDAAGSPSQVAFAAYRADWAGAIGPRDETVAMTRLDDDDALAPWVMARIAAEAKGLTRRAILMLPNGIRVYHGRFTVVRHTSNAMQTLVTPPGDTATVYDYGHRKARQFAPVRTIDLRLAWLWARHDDTISGWKTAQHPLSSRFRDLFDVDWSVFGTRSERPSLDGRVFA